MAMQVRPYAATDALGTWRAFHTAVRRTAILDYSTAQVAAWAPDDVDLDSWHQRRQGAFTLVADPGGEIAGFVDLADRGLIDMLFVHPDHSRRGVGRLLLTAVIQHASGQGLASIHTHASRTARPVFEQMGFVVDQARDPNWVRGVNLPNFDMHLDLE